LVAELAALDRGEKLTPLLGRELEARASRTALELGVDPPRQLVGERRVRARGVLEERVYEFKRRLGIKWRA
jgi:hypothetical protein